MKRSKQETKANPSGRTLSGAKRKPRKRAAGAAKKASVRPIRPAKAPSALRDAEFNLKQISDLMHIPRTTLYRLEESNEMLGRQKKREGATSKKVYTWGDVEILSEMLGAKVARPDEFQIKVVANLKGGVGKSTLASQVAIRAAASGVKTLLIDLDAQAHASKSLGFNSDDDTPTILNCIISKTEDKMSIEDVIVQITPMLSLVPSSLSVSAAESRLQFEKGSREERLKKILEPLRQKFDLILIDTNPSASLLNINALLAADELCLVTETDYLSVSGLKQMFEILKDLQEAFPDFSPNIRVIPNLFDVREAACQASLGALRQNYGDYLTNTVVRKNADMREAQNHAQAIFMFKKRSSAAEDIDALTKELLSEPEVNA